MWIAKSGKYLLLIAVEIWTCHDIVRPTASCSVVRQVAPAELEAVLLSHPDVVEAAVVGIADVTAGQLPAALVVTRPDTTTSCTDIEKFVAGRSTLPQPNGHSREWGTFVVLNRIEIRLLQPNKVVVLGTRRTGNYDQAGSHCRGMIIHPFLTNSDTVNEFWNATPFRTKRGEVKLAVFSL